LITWTIGAGGLLGNAIRRRRARPFDGSPVPWSDEDASARVLAADLARFRDEAGDEAWGIVWAAGAATVASSAEQAAAEVHTLEALLSALRAHPPSGPGAFFLTSSAGGVYAGSADPPFDADTLPVALGAYGELKLGQEAAAREALAGVCPLVIGRFSNLYGPGQNLDKLQGLISRLAQAAATQQPLNIFVSLDTLRDYIYVDDAALRAVLWLDKAVGDQSLEPRVRVIASGESVTVGQLIRTMNQVTKRRIPTALGSHASARNQVLDLRLVPSAADELADLPLTPLPAGAKRVYLDILRRLQAPTVTAPPSPR
jgi:UDP-glucose 4-epimerase